MLPKGTAFPTGTHIGAARTSTTGSSYPNDLPVPERRRRTATPAAEGRAGRGRRTPVRTVAAGEPDAVAAWLGSPAAAPHGGESVLDLIARAGDWLENLRGGPRRVLAVSHAAVIRAAIVHAIRATPESYWRVNVAPLTRTVLTGEAGRWNLRSIGHPLS
ncbi:histidine phosphatase family protein [Actinopolymorpha pittospori]|uniref:histidine phosphatase family protein n=1 Tax=Actinopolymorpha pittospori TaxID=648752 RepID=UPI00178BE7B5